MLGTTLQGGDLGGRAGSIPGGLLDTLRSCCGSAGVPTGGAGAAGAAWGRGAGLTGNPRPQARKCPQQRSDSSRNGAQRLHGVLGASRELTPRIAPSRQPPTANCISRVRYLRMGLSSDLPGPQGQGSPNISPSSWGQASASSGLQRGEGAWGSHAAIISPVALMLPATHTHTQQWAQGHRKGSNQWGRGQGQNTRCSA